MALVFEDTVVAPQFRVSRSKKGIKSESGLATQLYAKAIFDYGKTDSSGNANSAIGTHGLGVFLPPKAIIIQTWFEVVTGFTSAANTATVAIQAESAADIFAATAVSNAGLANANALTTGIQTGSAANMKLTTVERELQVVVGTQALTAGRLVLFVEYHLGE